MREAAQSQMRLEAYQGSDGVECAAAFMKLLTYREQKQWSFI
jgi:hypothetical protein